MAAVRTLKTWVPRKTRERALDSLRNDILNGRLLPGTHLMQHKLARELDISVNLAREVLLDLRASGLVTLERGVGFSVATLTVKGFMEAGEVRAVLDGLAARLCCQRATREDIERLRGITAGIHKECCEVGFDDRGIAHQMDRDLHDTMCAITMSPVLTHAMQACWIPMISVGNPSQAYQDRYEESYREHLAIIAAIEENRPDDAERLACEHRQTGMRRVQEEARRGDVLLRWY